MSEGGTTSVTNCLKNRDYITQGTPNAAAHTYQFVTFLGNQWAEDESGNMVLKPTTDVEVNNIENPLFLGVTVSSDAPTSIDFSGGQFVGTYCPLADTSHTLMDANNPANGAFHAAICSDPSALGQGSINWYNDAALTSPATAIPFAADGQVTLYAGLWVELADAADNSGTIETIVSSGSQNNRVAVLKDRKLYRDGDWNTLCLPFSLNEAQIAASSIAGVTIMELDGTTSNLTNGTLTLNFKETFRIEAGRPYIVKWQHPTVVINSAADWESFAAAVNNGTSYAGKLVQLGAVFRAGRRYLSDDAFPGQRRGALGHRNVPAAEREPKRHLGRIPDRRARRLQQVSGSGASSRRSPPQLQPVRADRRALRLFFRPEIQRQRCI